MIRLQKTDETKVRLTNLHVGDCFEFEERVWMKTDERFNAEEAIWCIKLEGPKKGHLFKLSVSYLVRPLRIIQEAIVEYGVPS